MGMWIVPEPTENGGVIHFFKTLEEANKFIKKNKPKEKVNA